MRQCNLLLLILVLWVCVSMGQIPRPVVMENGLLRVSFDKGSRVWGLDQMASGGWMPVITGASSSISFRDGDSLMFSTAPGEIATKLSSTADNLGKGKVLVVTLTGPDVNWTLELTMHDGYPGITVASAVRNQTAHAWSLRCFHLVDIAGAGALEFATDNVLLHTNGYQSWSASDVRRLDSASVLTSSWSAVFYEPEIRSSLLLGFLTSNAAINSFTAGSFVGETGGIHFSSSSDLRTVVLPPGKTFESDSLLIAFDSSPNDNLLRLAEEMQAEAPLVPKPFTPTGKEPAKWTPKHGIPAGWCSWYSSYQNISEDSILVNLNAASSLLKEAGLEYVQIDDGYQSAAGDWTTNKKFPHGHRWLVNQIHSKGLLAGLWVAPFAVAENSSVYRDHRDWLLRGENDSLKVYFINEWWGGRIYSLDPTIPGVQKWLRDLFAKIVNEWGYDYLKIDFLHFAAEGGKYFQNVSSAAAYRMGLESIRSGVGAEKFILGCGAPMGPSVGLVDGMRIGTDVSASWGGVTPGAQAAAHRFFYHGKVWYDDPDCLLVRDPLTLDEARIWASVVALSGQMNMLGDKLPDLEKERLELVQMTLPVYGAGALPVDLFSPPREEGPAMRTLGGESLMLPDAWKFSPGDSLLWKEPGFDDGRWVSVRVPAQWESQGYPGLDGFAWYRVKFAVPADWKRGPLTFVFGKVDDCDETYLNGQLIGRTGKFPPDSRSEWTTFRIYRIPEALVNWGGQNTLSVRVYDSGGAGGIYSVRQFTLPSIWNLMVQKPFGSWNVVGLFNWWGEEATTILRASDLGLAPGRKYLVYELWSGRSLGELAGVMSISLGPTSSNILSIHLKPEHPEVISTSRHITQGAVDLAAVEWDAKKGVLSISSDNLLLKGAYSVVLYVPPGMEILRVSAPGVRTAIKPVEDNLIKITLENVGREKLNWQVFFR